MGLFSRKNDTAQNTSSERRDDSRDVVDDVLDLTGDTAVREVTYRDGRTTREEI